MMDAAISLLARLNQLENEDGVRYSDLIVYHAHKPWLCHQQFVFDHCIVPFVRGSSRPNETRPFPTARQVASQLFYRTANALAFAKPAPGSHVWVYSVDSVDEQGSNRWLPGLHDAIRGRGERVLEIVWSVSGADALRFARRRQQSVIYWQGVAPFLLEVPRARTSSADQLDSESFLHDVALNVMLPRCSASVRTIARFESLLRRLAPTGVFLMDDSLHAFELVIACKRAGIPTVGIQHGQFSRFSVGLMGYGSRGGDISFDRYCVWGDWFKTILSENSELVPLDSIAVTGSCRRLSEVQPTPNHKAAAPAVLFVAEHYDQQTDATEVQPYLQAMHAAGIDVVVRPHPSTRGSASTNVPLDQLISQADVVVASHSSVIFEAILREKPVVLFETSLWCDPHSLAAAGIATLAHSPFEIAHAVRTAHATAPRERATRRQSVWGAAAQNGGKEAVRQMDDLRERDTHPRTSPKL